MPMISIIVPVYKVETYIRSCVESILNQTHTDLQVILVDDESLDNSGAICDEYAAKDDRVRVIHQKNAGVSAARNAGLNAAQGEYIGWVDSDDIIEADMFQRMVSLAERHDADIVQCQHDRNCVFNKAERTESICTMDGKSFVRRMFTKQGGAYTNQVALWSKIYRKTLWDDIRCPVGMVYEDEMQTYKVCLKAKTIVETEDVLYHYVKRENSIITGESHKKMLDKQKALEDRLNYLPTKLPDLEAVCAQSFLRFSANILCKMYQASDMESVHSGLDLLMTHYGLLRRYANKYERLYLPLLKTKYGRHWVLRNDFEPIQKIIRKVKMLK